jgi:hypothetical protein
MLNQDQQRFYDLIISGQYNQVLLTGEAGTGKTFTLTSALSELHRMGWRVLLCAPTHLAKLNLKEKLDDDVREFIPTKTVASLLKQFGFIGTTGDTTFTNPVVEDLSTKYDVIAIDECSMLGEAAFQALQLCNVRIIYTGDFAQLPVVMSKKSTMEQCVNLIRVHFTEQMRQLGVIHVAAELCRDAVVFPKESVADDNSEVIVHETLNKLIARYIGDLISDPRGMDAPLHYRFLTHRNATCDLVNSLTRDQFVGANVPFVVGEKVLVGQTIHGAPVVNGEVFTVDDVIEDLALPQVYNHPWRSYRILPRNGSKYINVVAPEDLHMVSARREFLRDRIKLALNNRDEDSYQLYHQEAVFIQKRWIKCTYPYAMTIHKSQGQTIENVYVNTQELSKAPHRRALLYVALSRASKSLHVAKVDYIIK